MDDVGVEDAEALRCPVCSYDLRGTEGDRCSECGTAFDRTTLRASGFPWANRGHIGRIRAYIRTVIHVTFFNRALKHAAWRTHDPADARLFRWMTVLLALPLVLGIYFAAEMHREIAESTVTPGSTPAEARWLDDLFVPWSAGVMIPGVVPVLLVLWMIGPAAHRPIFWLIGASAQRRGSAHALSDYAMAPLAWLLPVGIGVWAAYMIEKLRPDAATSSADWIFAQDLVLLPFAAVVWVGGLVAAIGLVASLVRILQWSAQIRGGGIVRMVLHAPLQYLLFWLRAFFYFGILAWLVGFFWIVIDSLR